MENDDEVDDKACTTIKCLFTIMCHEKAEVITFNLLVIVVSIIVDESYASGDYTLSQDYEPYKLAKEYYKLRYRFKLEVKRSCTEDVTA